MNRILFTVLFITQGVLVQAQNPYIPISQDSLKGSITKEREWWDVQFYDIHLKIDYANKRIQGQNIIDYNVVQEPHSDYMQIDLQHPLDIDSIIADHEQLSFERFGTVYIVQGLKYKSGSNKITVYYSGKPKESSHPPYDGGIVWAQDSLNRPWISVACQMVGGSVWYPCKDHYNEEPDNGASLTISVNDTLGVVVGNGRLKSRKIFPDNVTEYTWAVENPINNYGLSFYLGNYVNIQDQYAGEKGNLDLDFWILDYNYEKAKNHMIPEVRKTMKAFEKWYGPYPFYEDGFKMVESSYIGMEHQSAVAYGNKFKKGRVNFKNLTELDFKTDRLIVHEMAHEWFGNNITMSDIADRWVQEGFAAYGEELFIEELLGRDAGREFFVTRQKNFIKNKTPLISDYGIFKDAGHDMYFKGWAIIHMLREIVNDDMKWRMFLRDLNEKFRHLTIYSIQFEKYFSEYFDEDFSSFFRQYLRFPSIPVLEYKITKDKLQYRLATDVSDLSIPLKLTSHERWILATNNWKEIKLKNNENKGTLKIDPNFLIEVKNMH